jgi:two-component system, NtrC family, response regulator HydG
MFGHVESQSSLAKYPSSDEAIEHSAGIPARGHGVTGESKLEHFGALFGACDAMRTLFRQIERLARSTAPVIILGESGSGKELVATTLHQLSPRADRPFIAINCGAIAETLIESELFGHERGSFTGASRTHRGCFERASGGTLFLDEITEMPIDMQVRLLRVLETGRFSRVGGDDEISTDVRVLAASNRDLQQAVASGRLREDLMYRLCVIPLSVPPLRERNDDAWLLADMFLRNLNDEHAESKRLSARARECILEYRWPGNVRELKNVIHRAFVLSDNEVQVDIDEGARPECAPQPPVIAPPVDGSSTFGESFAVRIPVGMSLDEAEKALITATLQAVSGSKSKAAQVLGISLKTLYNRLHAYGAGSSKNKTASGADCSALAA